ncbi:symporter, partial [Bacillus inaquosorum]|nr:symporter [Bacillus inaquosorum]
GHYEGFWGLAANIIAVVILNPLFVKKAGSNPVIEGLFGIKQDQNPNQKGA